MKYFLTIFIATAIIFSCRKKEEREYNDVNTIGALHCANGDFDGDELGLDCGGDSCDPCDVNAAPCNQPDNQAYLENGMGYQVVNITSTSIDTTSSEKIEFYAYIEGSEYRYLKFIFPKNGRPDITKTYTGVNSDHDLEDDEVFAVFQNFGSDDTGNGTVYVTHENGAYTIESCNYDFVYGPSLDQWFRVTFTN